MAVDYFMKMDTIKGESNASGHQNEIDVLSYSWGATIVGASPGGSGRLEVDSFSFTHRLDYSTPLLLKACLTGQHIPTATFTARRSLSRGSADYLKYTFTEVVVSSIKEEGQGEALPAEHVGIQFGNVVVSARPVKADGSLGSPAIVDIPANFPAG
jgi:type VI secretion system secreted protein Hcp